MFCLFALPALTATPTAIQHPASQRSGNRMPCLRSLYRRLPAVRWTGQHGREEGHLDGVWRKRVGDVSAAPAGTSMGLQAILCGLREQHGHPWLSVLWRCASPCKFTRSPVLNCADVQLVCQYHLARVYHIHVCLCRDAWAAPACLGLLFRLYGICCPSSVHLPVWSSKDGPRLLPEVDNISQYSEKL